jgi:plasmid stability protein
VRTTLTIDDDVAAAIERRRREHRHSLKQEVNELLRAGLAHVEQERPKARPFRVEPLDVGKPLVENFDDISAVLAIAEGENHR